MIVGRMHMSRTVLESSIREESARLVAAIGEKEAAEIRRLDDSYLAGIESFTKQVGIDTEARLRQELVRIENRAGLERRKHKLVCVDSFINLVMDEVVSGLRLDPEYKRFLLNAVLDAARHIPAAVEVRLMAQDLVFETQIREIVKAAGLNRDMAIKEDPTIKLGGCLVFDVSGGRIFNHTIERVYFRKTLLIRREIMKILLDHSRDALSPASPPVGH